MAAVLRNYRPACDIFGLHVLLPETHDTPLRTKLMAIGCSEIEPEGVAGKP